MNYEEFLAKVIEDGMAAAKGDYTLERHKLRLVGSIAGFEACRGKRPRELGELLKEAREKTEIARRARAEDYWQTRCYELEIEWVCNVVSALLMNEGLSSLEMIVPPTARGVMKAANIIGVKGMEV